MQIPVPGDDVDTGGGEDGRADVETPDTDREL